jgi:hypothetical protein
MANQDTSVCSGHELDLNALCMSALQTLRIVSGLPDGFIFKPKSQFG